MPSINSDRDGNRSLPAQQGDVCGLRDYVPGDAIGTIAWKSAARGLGLQVRTFDSANGPSQALLSLQQTGKQTVEEQLSRLCAWVLMAEYSKTNYVLHLPDEQLDSSVGREQRLLALQALAMHGKAA